MLLTTDQLVGILRAGGGMRISANRYSFVQVHRFCSAAAQGRARLELIATDAFTPAQMLNLAETAPGYVLFDLSPPAPPSTNGVDRP